MNSDLSKVLKAIEESDIIAVDVETDGLNVRSANCIGLGIAVNDESGFYFSSESKQKTVVEALKGKKLIAWNAYFDLEIIRNNFNIDLWNSLHADVVCLKHTVDEERPFGLKEVAKNLFGLDATNEQKELKESIKKNGGSPNQFFKADPEILGKYCIQDCKLTIGLYNHYIALLKEENLEKFFFEDEVMPLYIEVTRFMQSRGIPVDLKLIDSLKANINKSIDELEDVIQEHIKPHLTLFKQWFLNKDYKISTKGSFAQGCIELSGKPIPKLKSGKFSTAQKYLEEHRDNQFIAFLLGYRKLSIIQIELVHNLLWKKENHKYMFNLDSKHHLKKLFFTCLGEEPVSKTLKGNPQVNDEFIELMADKYEWCKLLSDYNKLKKLKTAYIDRISEIQEDGIFYPQFLQHRTISGRYGSDLQQLPRLAEDGQFSRLVTQYRNQIRAIFKCPDSMSFIDADYESLEPHIFAHVSNEEKIKDIFRNGDDFYSTIAIDTEGLEGSANKKSDNYLGNINKVARQKAKTYALGIPYGMESYALSKHIKCSQEEAEFLIQKYIHKYPNLEKWMKQSNKDCLELGFVKSEAGRKRRLTEAKSILDKFGIEILDSLELWKKYGDNPSLHDEMKQKRKIVKNSLNNAKNFQIQSLAASITNRACIAINRAIKKYDAYVVAQIHDQIVVYCKNEDSEKIKEIVEDCMTNTYKISIPLKAPASIGKNLAETH